MKNISIGLVAAALLGASGCGQGDGSSSSSSSSTPPDPVTVTVQEPICGESADVTGVPTYYEDVAPILMENCANCHTPGGIAPFPLLTYEDTAPLAALIKARTTAREMPPFNPSNCGHCNTFKDAHWLTTQQIATIAVWADGKAPAGDPAKAPPVPEPPQGLAGVNLTLDTLVDYMPDIAKTDDYRCFVVDPGLVSDKFLTGYEVLPGNRQVVHHVIAHALDTAAADAAAVAKDDAEAGPGYTCYGGPGVTDSRFVVGWAPGGRPTTLPAGTGLRLSAGRKVVIQIHYNLANGPMPDRTKIALTVADSIGKEALISGVSAAPLVLPPGQALVEQSGEMVVPAQVPLVKLWAVGPHMHTAGKTMRIEADHQGTKTCLLDVQNWDFHWQSFWQYDTPIQVQGGDTIRITCGYDTTGRVKPTYSGEGTEDEMCIGFFYATW
jgi:hypothetical protein